MKRGKICNSETAIGRTGMIAYAGNIPSMLTKRLRKMNMSSVRSRSGMELVQVGILIAIAIALGIIFKDKIQEFENHTFAGLLVEKFQSEGRSEESIQSCGAQAGQSDSRGFTCLSCHYSRERYVCRCYGAFLFVRGKSRSDEYRRAEHR